MRIFPSVCVFVLISISRFLSSSAAAAVLTEDIVSQRRHVLERLEKLVTEPDLKGDDSDEFDVILTQNEPKMASVHEGQRLVPLYFHTNSCTVSTRNMRMYSDDVIRKTKTNFPRKTIALYLAIKQLWVDGVFSIDRLAYSDTISRAAGTFSVSITGLKCDGTVAIEGESVISIEWLQLFCHYKRATTNTQLKPRIVIGAEVSKLVSTGSFKTELSKRIERGTTDGLELLTNLWLTSRLKQIPGSIKRNGDLRKQESEYSSRQEELDANEILDTVLGIASVTIRDSYNDTLKIPDIREGFEKKVLNIVPIGALFLATEGTAQDVSTIERAGNARIQTVDEKLYFMGTLRFRTLHLMYKRFRAQVLGLGPSGMIATNFAPVAVRLKLHVDFDKRHIELDNFRITELGNVKVNISGIAKIVDWIISKIATWVVAMFKNQVLDLVQDRITSAVRETLAKNTIDEIITGEAVL